MSTENTQDSKQPAIPPFPPAIGSGFSAYGPIHLNKVQRMIANITVCGIWFFTGVVSILLIPVFLGAVIWAALDSYYENKSNGRGI